MQTRLTKSECDYPDITFKEDERQGAYKSKILTPSMRYQLDSYRIKGENAYQKRRPTNGTRAIRRQADSHDDT